MSNIGTVKFGPQSKYVMPSDVTLTGYGRYIDATGRPIDDITFKGSSTFNYVLAGDVDNVDDHGYGNTTDVWSADDVEMGGVYGQLFAGGIWDDVFIGGMYNFVYAGYVGGDVEMASFGSTAIFGWVEGGEVNLFGDLNFVSTGDNDDVVQNFGSGNIIQTGYGDDEVVNYGGDLTAYLGEGDDNADGSDAVDVFYGEGGDDNLFGEGGNDQLFGGTGDDYMTGGAGNDVIAGGDGDDYLDGDDGDDYLGGNDGGDVVNGNDGDDVIIDGNGNDYMSGGQGADVFIFDLDTTAGSDLVADYDASQDQILVNLNNQTFDGAALAAASEGTFSYGDSSLTVYTDDDWMGGKG